jgi:hypothetical protein
MVSNYEFYLAIAGTGIFTGVFMNVGGAITEIWIKPWLKKLKRRHDKLIKKIKNSKKGFLRKG